MRSQQPKDKRRRGQRTRLQVEHTVHRNVGENEGKRRQGVLGDIRAHQRAQASSDREPGTCESGQCDD